MEAAFAEYHVSEAGAAATRLAVAAQIAEIYISICALQTSLKVAQQYVQTQQELPSTIKLLYDKGLAAELQVRQVKEQFPKLQPLYRNLTRVGGSHELSGPDARLAAPGTGRAELAEAGVIPVVSKTTAAEKCPLFV